MVIKHCYKFLVLFTLFRKHEFKIAQLDRNCCMVEVITSAVNVIISKSDPQHERCFVPGMAMRESYI